MVFREYSLLKILIFSYNLWIRMLWVAHILCNFYVTEIALGRRYQEWFSWPSSLFFWVLWMSSLTIFPSLPWLLGSSEANVGSSLDKLEVLRHVFDSNVTIGFFCFPASFISSLKVKLWFHNMPVHKWPYSFFGGEKGIYIINSHLVWWQNMGLWEHSGNLSFILNVLFTKLPWWSISAVWVTNFPRMRI